MKQSTSMRIPPVSVMILGVAFLLATTGIASAQVTTQSPAGQVQLQPNLQLNPVPKPKLCPDLKVSLTAVKGGSGMVTLNGTVANAGPGDYNLVSTAQVIMNLSYAPQYSYAMTGVSDILVTKPFTKVKKGETFTVNSTFQIPKFDGWAAGSVQGNAKRLFTLRVIKQDMSPYQPGEDCNSADNTKSVEIAYREKKP